MAQYSEELKNMLYKTLLRSYRIQQKGKVFYYHINLDFIDIGLLSAIADGYTIKGLCQLTQLERRVVAKAVDRFVKAGFVTKQPVVDDKRSVQLALTEQGNDCVKAADQFIRQPIDFATAELTLNEEKAVLKYLSRLHQALKQFE